MSDIPNPGSHSQEEINELANLISEALDRGEPRDKLLNDLVNNGWEKESAEGLMGAIEHAKYAQPTHAAGGGDGGGMGWLIWIGALVVINLCSYLFNWGFWLY